MAQSALKLRHKLQEKSRELELLKNRFYKSIQERAELQEQYDEMKIEYALTLELLQQRDEEIEKLHNYIVEHKITIPFIEETKDELISFGHISSPMIQSKPCKSFYQGYFTPEFGFKTSCETKEKDNAEALFTKAILQNNLNLTLVQDISRSVSKSYPITYNQAYIITRDNFIFKGSENLKENVIQEVEKLCNAVIACESEKPKNKYDCTIKDKYTGKSIVVDVYRVLVAFDVKCPALQHLIKKALCIGLRGHKDQATDLQDIIDSAIEAKKLYENS